MARDARSAEMENRVLSQVDDTIDVWINSKNIDISNASAFQIIGMDELIPADVLCEVLAGLIRLQRDHTALFIQLLTATTNRRLVLSLGDRMTLALDEYGALIKNGSFVRERLRLAYALTEVEEGRVCPRYDSPITAAYADAHETAAA